MEAKIKYWVSEANESYQTAKVLFENSRYLESAFFCHLAIEKNLKAFIVFRKNMLPPKIHNLLMLAERSELSKQLTEKQLDFLADLNLYQLEGRYPGDRELLYTQTTLEKFKEIITNTEGELIWLEQKLRLEISSLDM